VSDELLSDIRDALGEKDSSGQVEAIREIFDHKNIKMKSDLNKKMNESFYFSKLFCLSKLLDMKILAEFCNEEITLRVSNDRMGRREAVDISRSHPMPEKRRGLFGFLGGGSV